MVVFYNNIIEMNLTLTSKILETKLTDDLKYEFAFEGMIHLNWANWLTDREVNGFVDLLNNEHQVVKVLCIHTCGKMEMLIIIAKTKKYTLPLCI